MDKLEYRYIATEIRTTGKQGKTLKGYAIVFNRLSENLGGFRELITPDAVKRSINSNADIRAYYNHDTSKILGRRSVGTLRLGADDKGLWFEIDTPPTSYASDLLVSVNRGDVSGASFRFKSIKDKFEKRADGMVRIISDMEIGEISPVSEPAYAETKVDVRSREQRAEIENARLRIDLLRI